MGHPSSRLAKLPGIGRKTEPALKALGININGGIWSEGSATLNGNANVTYNGAYMEAIGNIRDPGGNLPVPPRLISWREKLV